MVQFSIHVFYFTSTVSLFKEGEHQIKHPVQLKNRKQVLACTTKYSYKVSSKQKKCFAAP